MCKDQAALCAQCPTRAALALCMPDAATTVAPKKRLYTKPSAATDSVVCLASQSSYARSVLQSWHKFQTAEEGATEAASCLNAYV